MQKTPHGCLKGIQIQVFFVETGMDWFQWFVFITPLGTSTPKLSSKMEGNLRHLWHLSLTSSIIPLKRHATGSRSPAELPVVFQVATFWVWMQHSKTLWVIFLQKTDQMKQPPGSSQPQVCNFIKKVILAHMSSCQFWEVFKNKFFTVHHWATAFEPTEQLFVNLWNFVVRFTAKKQTNKQYIYSFLWYTSSRSAY